MTVNYRDLLYRCPAKSPQVAKETSQLHLRDRSKKKEKGKVTFTERDHRLFEVLKRVRCLSQEQIIKLLNLSTKAYRNRLHRLSCAGYLRKISYGQRGGVYGVIWTGGKQVRSQINAFSPRNLFEVDHQLGLNQIYLDLILAGYDSILDWYDGIYSPIPFGNTLIKPDAVLKLSTKATTILIEYDRGTRPLRTVGDQLTRYRDYFMSPYCKQTEQVWVITSKEGRCRTVSEVTKSVCKNMIDEIKISVLYQANVLSRMQQIVGQPPKPPKNHQPTNMNLTPDVNTVINALRPFCEEAVSMYYRQNIPLPESYKEAATVLFT